MQGGKTESMQTIISKHERFRSSGNTVSLTVLLVTIGIILTIPFPLIWQGRSCFAFDVLLVFCVCINFVILSFTVFVFSLEMVKCIIAELGSPNSLATKSSFKQQNRLLNPTCLGHSR